MYLIKVQYLVGVSINFILTDQYLLDKKLTL